MAKINTDLNTNVQLENAPTPEAVSVGSGSQIVGKSGFDALADTLASINPRIRALADQKFKEQNEQKANEGAAKINGMTLEESKTAHKNGFPDIYNGWARFGAYKQYANNSADKFIQDGPNIAYKALQNSLKDEVDKSDIWFPILQRVVEAHGSKAPFKMGDKQKKMVKNASASDKQRARDEIKNLIDDDFGARKRGGSPK